MNVPEPVGRFLARSGAGHPGDPRPTSVRLRQRGDFLLREGARGWRPFTATEWFELDPPAFEWRASIRVAPLVGVEVTDRYEAGRGTMRARLLRWVSLVDEDDDGDLAEGALSRYLAEAAWFPWRLRPGEGLTWRDDDRDHATATLVDHGVTAVVRFGFDETGDLVETSALRKRKVADGYVATPWIGHFGDHRDAGGVRVPTSGEVAWIVDGQPRPYWRGHVTDIRWDPA